MKISFLAVFVILACQMATAQARGDLKLGVLEDTPGEYAGEANIRTVRAVFRKSGTEWIAYKNDCGDQDCLKSAAAEYPQQVTWTISFDGKNLGQLTSRAPKAFATYWRIGQQELPNDQPVPTVGARSNQFGGFLDMSVYRPLLAISQPNFKDPDMWKPRPVPTALLQALRGAFRYKYPRLCRTELADETKLLPYDYKDSEIKLVKSYAASTGWMVARLHIEATDCADTEAGFGIDDPWFTVDPKGAIRFLGLGMWLVDAGDYDNDGKSELLFSINRHNRGGYTLFYDDFKKHADFKFGYH